MLSAENLRVRYRTPRGWVAALRGVSFACGREKLGLVGESGSGKSTIGRAILKLLPPRARLEADSFRFNGVDLAHCGAAEMRALRGRRLAMILQDPAMALNPVMSIGAQIAEAYRTHHGLSAREARARGLEMLAAVHIKNPVRMWRAHAHELSGGMSQRAVIAMMLAAEPDLLIADEPTSALDVVSRQAVLEILDELVSGRGMGLLFISHDLGLVSSFCDRILVLRDGVVVETLAAAELEAAKHPHTRALLAARPKLEVALAAKAAAQ